MTCSTNSTPRPGAIEQEDPMGESPPADRPAPAGPAGPGRPAKAAAAEQLQLRFKQLIDELMAARTGVLQLEERLSAAATQLSGVEAALADLERARRRPLGDRVWAWVGALITALVGVGLIVLIGVAWQVLTGSALSDLAQQSATLAARVQTADAELKRVRTGADQIQATAAEILRVKAEYEGAAAAVKNELKGLETSRKQIAAIAEQAQKDARFVETKLSGMVSDLASKIGPAVATANVKPLEATKAALDDLALQVRALRLRLREPARPERTSVVLFDSEQLRAATCQEALERLFRATLLRTGYDGYQIALYLASNGALKPRQPLIPFGEEPAPGAAFQHEWVTEPGSVDGMDRFNPEPVLSAAPAGVPRRCVLIVSPAAEAPKPPVDGRWALDVRTNVLVVGPADTARRDAWAKFCQARHGTARSVAVETGAILAALNDFAKPDPVPVPKPEGPRP
jgi:hypothetical protein